MFNSFRAVCALSLLWVPASLHAQESVAPVPNVNISKPSDEPEISLETLLELAAKNNPQPAIARANLEAARERAGALRSLPNPVLQIVPGIGGTPSSRDEEIILSQPLDVFGSRSSQRRVLEAEARRALADETLVLRSLQIEVRNAAANLFAAQEAQNLGETQVEIARQFREAAARKAQLGDVPAVQTQRAQLELDRAQNDLENARAERLVRRAVLNQLVGQEPQMPLRVALTTGLNRTASPVVSGVAPTNTAPLSTPPVVGASSQVGSDLVAARSQILPQALAARPDLLGAQATLEARQANVNAIARSRFPQLELQARRGGVFDSASTSLRAVVTVPIFDFGSIKRERAAAQAQVRAQEAEIALLRSQIGAQVESALVRLNQQRATVERYRTSLVPQSLDLLRKTQIGYAQGASTFLEVLDAQRAARQTQTEYLQALVGVNTSETALQAAFGAQLPANLTGALSNPTGANAPDGTAAPGTLPEGTIPPVQTEPINQPWPNSP